MSLQDIITSDRFTRISDYDAIVLFGEAFPAELDRLKHAVSPVESSNVQPRGAFGEDHVTPSQLLYGNDFAEVNRTLVSMLAIKWL